MDNILFKKIIELQNEMNQTNSSLKKKEILKKYPELKKILKYVYDKNIIYNMKSKNYKKYIKNKKKIKIKINKNIELFQLLDDLNNRKITGDKSLLYLYNYIINHKEFEDIILNIIDKNLKIRVNTKIINNIFPNLIKEFKVVLANKYDKKHIKPNEEWFISRKLDGIRCLTHIDIINKNITFYSRQGKIFNTLENLKKDILNNINVFSENCFLDGEVVDMNNNKENFKGIMEKIRRKNYQIENPKYYTFDIIKEEDFYNQISDDLFYNRQEKLSIINENFKNIIKLEQIKYTDDSFKNLIKKSFENNWEGLMIRKNCQYEGKRTNNLLKYKEWRDEEYKVKSIEIGNIRFINKKTGLEEEIETLTSVIIDYNNTKVGSGFSLEERKMFHKNPDLIINKIITVKYFEKTKDSLRFPIFKGLHGNKRDT